MKDGIGNFIVHGQEECAVSRGAGTQSWPITPSTLEAGDPHDLPCLLATAGRAARRRSASFAGNVFAFVARRRPQEADEFYAAIISSSLDADVAQRDAAGVGWDGAAVQAVLFL